MTYDMKPLACDPTRIKGMSEQLIIELVATSSTRFKTLITKTGAVAKSSSASCKFIYTENLLPEAQVSTAEEGPSTKALQPPSAAIPILDKAIMQMETEDGWVGLGAVGQRLANIASDFDPRTYGYRKLSDLVRKTGAFDIDQVRGPGNADQSETEATIQDPRHSDHRPVRLYCRNPPATMRTRFPPASRSSAA